MQESLIIVDEETSNTYLEEASEFYEGEESDDNRVTGFVGTKPGDTLYGSVIEAVEGNVIFEEVNPAHAPDEKDKLEWALIKNRSPLFYPRKENVLIHVKADIISS